MVLTNKLRRCLIINLPFLRLKELEEGDMSKFPRLVELSLRFLRFNKTSSIAQFHPNGKHELNLTRGGSSSVWEKLCMLLSLLCRRPRENDVNKTNFHKDAPPVGYSGILQIVRSVFGASLAKEDHKKPFSAARLGPSPPNRHGLLLSAVKNFLFTIVFHLF